MGNKNSVKLFLTLLFLCTINFYGINQTDFSAYHSLQSEGQIPEVFTVSTESKVELAMAKDRSAMTEDQERVFLENIHHRVDDILQSGLILFGDPTTNYVRRVADRLLQDEPTLKKELQFFVLKSNVTNALSTDQGIIFVTLGLLAQLENEAQLAYILAHEIVHFQEAHVEASYAQQMNTQGRSNYDDRIKRMSSHSRDQELEADKKGVVLYYQAGYSKDELLSAFDVMMYSYLPFDEIPFDREYFRTEMLFIPDYYYPKEINEIQAEEDYDDRKSTHPNIRKRKDQIINELEDYNDWGESLYLLTEEEFEDVRDIARFESIRLDLLDVNYGDALYSIYLLERDFPNNVYLTQSKAQAWLGLAQFKLHGEYARTTQQPSSVEGESHAVHFLLRKMTKLQLLTVALRQTEDAYKKFPKDEVLGAIRLQMIDEIAGYSKFSLSKYKSQNYEEALEEFEEKKAAILADTIVEEEELNIDEDLSKYERIKKKKKSTTEVEIDEEFDFKKFHLYAISDLIHNAGFKKLYRNVLDQIAVEKEEKDRLWSLSDRELQEEMDGRPPESESRKGFILLDPSYSQYRYGVPYLKGAEEKEDLIMNTLLSTADKFGVEIHDLSGSDVSSQNTDSYNERALLMDYLRQIASFESFNMFPVDYLKMKDLRKIYGDSKLLFVFAEYNRTKVTHRTELSAVLINIETGQLETIEDYFFKRRPRNLVLEGYVYDLMSQLSTENK